MPKGPRRLNIPGMGEIPPSSGAPEKEETPSPAPREGGRRLFVDENPAPAPARQEGGRRLFVDQPAASKGARRLSFPEAEPTMADDRRPRRINIPDASTPPTTGGERSRRIAPEPTPSPAPAPSQQRSRTISPTPVPPPATPASVRQPLPAPGSGVRREPLPPRDQRTKSKTDLLLDKAKSIDPSVQLHRLRARIDTILQAGLTEILDWGRQNLEPLQDASNRKAKIAADLSRINAVGWLNEAMTASSKLPSKQTLWDRLKNEVVKSPDYYEGMLRKARAELLVFVAELNTMKNEFFREIGDLHCDAISMMVCLDEMADPHVRVSADGRARMLLASHQTAAMLQQTIENSLALATKQIQEIDSFLSVSMPQWRMAYQNR